MADEDACDAHVQSRSPTLKSRARQRGTPNTHTHTHKPRPLDRAKASETQCSLFGLTHLPERARWLLLSGWRHRPADSHCNATHQERTRPHDGLQAPRCCTGLRPGVELRSQPAHAVAFARVSRAVHGFETDGVAHKIFDFPQKKKNSELIQSSPCVLAMFRHA